MRHTNPSKNVHYDNEDELKQILEQKFLPFFYDNNWIPINGQTKEVRISPHDIVDYYGIKDGEKTCIEVKNWFVRKKDVAQIASYKSVLKNTALYLICGGIEPKRRDALEEMDVKIILVKNIQEIKEELAAWI